MVDFIQVKKRLISTPIPPSNQKYFYSCGASSVKSVFNYWGIYVRSENDILHQLKPKLNVGIRPMMIKKIAENNNLNCDMITGMSIRNLKKFVQDGIPVICSIQAWKDKWFYDRLLSGHYVTVVGFDDKHIYIQDSAIPKYYGFLTIKEFNERWFDVDYDRIFYYRLGIPIWSDNGPKNKKYKNYALKIC